MCEHDCRVPPLTRNLQPGAGRHLSVLGLLLVLSLVAGCGNDRALTPMAAVDYEAGTCEDFGAQFGTFLNRDVLAIDSTGKPKSHLIDVPHPGDDPGKAYTYIQNVTFAHTSALAQEIVTSRTLCGAERILAGAEPNITPRARRILVTRTPKFGNQSGTMESWEEWKTSWSVVLDKTRLPQPRRNPPHD